MSKNALRGMFMDKSQKKKTAVSAVAAVTAASVLVGGAFSSPADLLDDAYSNNLTDADFVSFVDTQGLGRDDRLVPEIIEKVYDSARCHMDPEKWLETCLRSADVQSVQDAAGLLGIHQILVDLPGRLDALLHHFLGDLVKGDTAGLFVCQAQQVL